MSTAQRPAVTDDRSETAAPMLRVVRGDPTDEELAALTAVIPGRTGTAPTEPEPLRRPLPPWVASGLVKGTRTKA